MGFLRVPEIQDVDISAQANVVGEIVASVIRILINYNLVRAPLPIAAKRKIRIRNGEVGVTKPESRGAASG